MHFHTAPSSMKCQHKLSKHAHDVSIYFSWWLKHVHSLQIVMYELAPFRSILWDIYRDCQLSVVYASHISESYQLLTLCCKGANFFPCLCCILFQFFQFCCNHSILKMVMKKTTTYTWLKQVMFRNKAVTQLIWWSGTNTIKF